MSTPVDTSPWRTLIFPPSTLCDLSVWLMTHYGIPNRVEPHTIPLLFLVIIAKGGKGPMPFVVRGQEGFDTIDGITGRFEPEVSADLRLIPEDPAAKAEVEKLFNEYNDVFGLATAQVAYYYLLPKRKLMLEPFTRGVPLGSRIFAHLAYPLITYLIRRQDSIYEPQIPQAIETINKAFDVVDERLSDGRDFLMGDTLTLADFAFSEMAVPVVWPADYGGASPPFDVLPQELKDVITPLRERPAGRFALNIYSEYRFKSPTNSTK